MIKSMTGYGRATASANGKIITCEVKSVNQRYFDCTVKLPRIYGYLEEPIKKRMQTETSRGQYRLRPLYYVTDADKAWYRDYYGIRYSDAYEVYGLTRTGCCGCPISYKAVEDLEKIRPYEPNVVKAAYNIFGKSYAYREKYNAYKKRRMEEETEK